MAHRAGMSGKTAPERERGLQSKSLRPSWTSRRLGRGTMSGFAKERLLDLCCDLSQPFFCAVGSMPIMLKVGLKALYALFGVSKLVRELLRYVNCMVVVFFTYLRRLVKERQNVLPRDVQPIRRIQGLGLSGRRERNYRFRFSGRETTTTHNRTTHDITPSVQLYGNWTLKCGLAQCLWIVSRHPSFPRFERVGLNLSR